MMTASTATICRSCGGALPPSSVGAATGACPVCGEPADPNATLLPPGPALTPPTPAAPDMPTRLPLAPLVVLAVSCALMGVSVGVWLGWQREPPAARTETRLPTLPTSGPTFIPAPSPGYPPPAAPTGPPALPPPRVTPPGWRPTVGAARTSGAGWGLAPGVHRAGLPLPDSTLAPHAAPNPAPLKAKGMATIRISNPSDHTVDVTLSGTDAQVGVVGPRAEIDFLIPPGRYDVVLRSAARTQRFYDAPLAEGEVLALVYSNRR